MNPLELWAGVEATVNRVGDRVFDQLERSGHKARIDDLDLIAETGIRTVRYPFLWEHLAPHDPEEIDWRWSDARLERLFALGLRPIAGLLHHGSGPRYTSLVDERFPEALAAFARAFAERYPSIEDYTPVNEPLTTARFSGLYGVWYPHGRDDPTFYRALVHQLKGTVLSMAAIRAVNPRARLIQTEDYGRTTCSPGLEYQADFENERRWLTFDLLCGRVSPEHPLYDYVRQVGRVSERDLAFFVENACPPDVLGVNYYITSDRYLDKDLARHRAEICGGNGRDRYADVETVLVGPITGHAAMLADVHERYARPVAVTEVHIDCGREDQLRWLMEAWEAAHDARTRGVDVRGVTVWSLFGSFDWNSLVTVDRGHYEPGAFDIRAPRPRPTSIARTMRALATAGTFHHPVLSSLGWWRRRHGKGRRARCRPVLISGATGTLGRAIGRICAARGLEHRLLTRRELDITSRRSIERTLALYEPWAVINAAGYVRVDDAEADEASCIASNVTGAARLAEACGARGLSFLTFSSDLVFDGGCSRPYVETDAPAPLNVYGRSKALAETEVLAIYPEALIVRTSAFFGPWDEHNFVAAVLRSLARGQSFSAPGDITVSPTHVPSLVDASLDLLLDAEHGIWHLANRGAITWAEFARSAATVAKLDPRLVDVCAADNLGFRAMRPRYSALSSARHALMPELEASLFDCVRAGKDLWLSAPRRRQP